MVRINQENKERKARTPVATAPATVPVDMDIAGRTVDMFVGGCADDMPVESLDGDVGKDHGRASARNRDRHRLENRLQPEGDR